MQVVNHGIIVCQLLNAAEMALVQLGELVQLQLQVEALGVGGQRIAQEGLVQRALLCLQLVAPEHLVAVEPKLLDFLSDHRISSLVEHRYRIHRPDGHKWCPKGELRGLNSIEGHVAHGLKSRLGRLLAHS